MADQRRRERHLIDFDNPRPRPAAARSGMSMTQVQRWVASALAFVTIEHLAFGIALAAILAVPEQYVVERIVMNVLAAVTGVLAVVLCRAIHSKGPLSPWLLVGLVPGLVGAYFSFT